MNPKAIAYLQEEGLIDTLLTRRVIDQIEAISGRIATIIINDRECPALELALPHPSLPEAQTVEGRLRYAARELAHYRARIVTAQAELWALASAIGIEDLASEMADPKPQEDPS